jgi:hypothetical protein
MTLSKDTPRLRLRDEAGSALVAAIALLTIMVGMSLALLAYVDTETKQSGVSRNRESAFNIAEAAMNAQIFALSQNWPGTGARALLQCLPATGGAGCPVHTQLQGLFPTTDTDPAMQWKTQIVDNQPPYSEFFSDAMLSGTTYGWDRGGKAGAATPDGKVWVRAEATSRGRTRTMVALVRAEEQQEDIVNSALVAGSLDITNMGKKVLIDNTGGGPIELRCSKGNGLCAGHEIGHGALKNLADLQSLLDQQVTPSVINDNSTLTGMSTESLQRLRATAIAKGTFYTSCPGNLTGDVVWLENLNCSYTSNGVSNSAANPGMVIANGGSLYMGGNSTYYGILYYTDLDGTNTIPATGVIELSGTTNIVGGIMIDGAGRLEAGSSGLNIKFDANAFAQVRTIGAAGIVQNTWRELTPY